MSTDLISLPSITSLDTFNTGETRRQNGFSYNVESPIESSPTFNQQSLKSDSGSPPKRKRVRTGCLTCRKRHRKCDEQHPKCLSCQQKGFECVWPVKTGVFVNNSQNDFSTRGRRKIGNRIGDRIMSTIQQEQIPATLDAAEKQRSSSVGTQFFSNNSTIQAPPQENLKFLTKRSHSEFTGMAESPTTTPLSFQTSTTAYTTRALSMYSDNLQAISLLPYSNSKMDLPSLLNGGEIHYNNRDANNNNNNTTKSFSTSSNMSPKSSFKHEETPASSLDDFFMNIDSDSVMDHNDYNDLHNILRDFMYLKNNNANVLDDTLSPDLFSLPDDIRTFEDLIDVHSEVNKPRISEVEKTELLRNFAMVIAPSLDMFDVRKHFSRVIPRLAMECPALLYACLAYSAKHLERLDQTYPRIKLVEFYRYSLHLLIPTIKTNTVDLKIVSACVLLCCLEMMSSSPMNWRRHLEGCFALFTSCNINGFSEDSLSRALFWAFARMDICSSIISEKTTIIPFKNWIPSNWSEYNLRKRFTDPKYNETDMYANYMVFLSSRVMNLLYNVEPEIDSKFDVEWEKLWEELKEWELNRPEDMLPILSFFDASHLNSIHGTPERQHTSPFPTALFTNAPAISGNQMFHMAVILMMQNKPRLYKFPLIPTGNKFSMIHRSIMSHARQIIAISVTNRDHGAWINMIQPFWIAGKLMGAEAEQKVILKTIKELEELTGWAIAWRGRDLVEYWNRNI